MQYEILVDHGETSNKCTIVPLRDRQDFVIKRIIRGQPLAAFKSQILLHPDGKPLNELTPGLGTVSSIAAVDCVWRRLDPILKFVAQPLPHLAMIPAGFTTAYPRQSKMEFDPVGGLATIEALFIAATFLGVCDLSLFAKYFFAERFLDLNRPIFLHYGIALPPVPAEGVFLQRDPRSSIERRRARGRVPKCERF